MLRAGCSSFTGVGPASVSGGRETLSTRCGGGGMQRSGMVSLPLEGARHQMRQSLSDI